VLSDQFSLPDLKLKCLQVIMGDNDYMTVKNCVRLFHLSHTTKHRPFQTTCVRFIWENYRAVVEDDPIFELPRDVMRALLLALSRYHGIY